MEAYNKTRNLYFDIRYTQVNKSTHMTTINLPTEAVYSVLRVPVWMEENS